MNLDDIQNMMGDAHIRQLGYRDLPLLSWSTYLTLSELAKPVATLQKEAIPWEEVFLLASEVLDE